MVISIFVVFKIFKKYWSTVGPFYGINQKFNYSKYFSVIDVSQNSIP